MGFTGPDAEVNRGPAAYAGAVATRFGNRKPPAAAYAGGSPVLHYDEKEETFVGGMFWDGNATGEKWGDPLAEQAVGPFLNPLEQNLADSSALCQKVKSASYAPLFEQVWGPRSLDCGEGVERTFERIGRSIAAYERSREVNPFSSKYDAYLRGKVKLTDQEALGLELFAGKGKCSNCHPHEVGSDGKPPAFTDFSYDNLGVPRNPHLPFYGMKPPHNPDGKKWVDAGLGGFLKAAGRPKKVYEPEWGKMKVPTLRNVDRRPQPDFPKLFCHNGAFDSLQAVVHFYNTRDRLPVCKAKAKSKPGVECWPPPEVTANMNRTEMGNLGLSADEELAIVAFLQILSDGF